MNVIIIHGCPSNIEKSMDPERRTYDKHWIPWVKKQLEDRGILTSVPLMPEPWEPIYKDWKKEFEKQEINEDTLLIGHSCGGGFLVRWLGETKKKIKKLILIAPAIMHSGDYAPLVDLLRFKVDKTIKDNIGKIIIFSSDNDSEGILKSVKIFSKIFGVKPIILKGHGHYTLGDMGTNKFPELLIEILK